MNVTGILTVAELVSAYAEIDRLHAESVGLGHKDAESGGVRFRNGSRVAELTEKIRRSKNLVSHALFEMMNRPDTAAEAAPP